MDAVRWVGGFDLDGDSRYLYQEDREVLDWIRNHRGDDAQADALAVIGVSAVCAVEPGGDWSDAWQARGFITTRVAVAETSWGSVEAMSRDFVI